MYCCYCHLTSMSLSLLYNTVHLTIVNCDLTTLSVKGVRCYTLYDSASYGSVKLHEIHQFLPNELQPNALFKKTWKVNKKKC